MKKISVIYSFRNEESVLPELIKRTKTSLDSMDYAYEIIFINDASSDKSREVLLSAIETDKSIKVINMSNRFGQTQCLLAGLRNCNGDCAIFLDSDLQDPPELFPEMIKKWEEGCEVVNTKRTSRAGENPLKMLLTRVGYLGWNKLSKIDLPIEAGDFKLIDRKIIDILSDIDEEYPFVRGLVTWIGFKQGIVEYDRQARHSGETHFPFFGGDPIETFLIGMTSFSIVPLYLALLLSTILIICSIVYLATMFMSVDFSIWKFLGLLISGLNFLCFGIMGAYIGRIHIQSRKRPLYVIKDKENFS